MSSATKDMSRRANTHVLELFCSDFDMAINPLNNGYQLRVENLVDFYPTSGRYCILQSGERGDWNTAQDLRRVMLKALGKPSQDLIDNWAGVNTITIKGDGFKTIGNQPQEFNVLHNVNTMSEAEYNKPHRRLWRAIRRAIWRRK